jgi:hypothetical protein
LPYVPRHRVIFISIVLRKNDGTIRAVIWQDHTNTKPLIYRYRDINYNNLSSALDVNGFPFSDIQLSIAHADDLDETEIEVLRYLQDTIMADSLLIPLDGLFGVVGGDGTESISLSIAQMSRDDLFTADFIHSGTLLRLIRNSEETGTVTIFIKAEFKNAMKYQIFEVTVVNQTMVLNPQGSQVIVYPNPVNHALSLTGKDLQHYYQTFIYDITGKIIQSIPVRDLAGNLMIDTSGFADGIYLLTLYGADQFEDVCVKFLVRKNQ